MKNFFVSAGLAAVGVAGLQSALAVSPTSPQYWNVSATLRGFYDDNYAINGANKGSFGVEFLPSASFHMPFQQTDIGIRYTYGLYYYQDRNDANVNPYDQTHQVDLWLDHAFSENWHGRIDDTFAVGQEPELLSHNPLTPVATPYRISGDNISNHGNLALNTDWTRQLSTSLTYGNNFYNYENHGTYVSLLPGVPTLVTPGTGIGTSSLAGILDRDEENVALDLKWHIQQETTAFIGYQFAWVNYIGNEPIAVVPSLMSPGGYFIYHSSDRDMDSHYLYLGLEHTFLPNLTGVVRVGGTYNDVYGDPLFPSTSWTPYADLSLSYTYLPGSYVQLGFTHDISSTDQIMPNLVTGRITQYQECSVIYADVNHRITSKLIATVIGRIQYSTFEGGAVSSQDETAYSLGLNLNYQINPHFSVDAGYNYDNVQTDISGYQYTRNRVYLGVTASY